MSRKIKVLSLVLILNIYSLFSQKNISNERQLFIDDFIVDSINNLEYELHEPIQVENLSLPLGYYQSLIKYQNEYLLYYREYLKNYNGKLFDGNPGEITKVLKSSNGVNWEDLIVNNENESINVVFYEPPYNHNFTPFIDTNPNSKLNEKFKAVSGLPKVGGLYLFVSADGNKWTRRKKPLFEKSCKFCFDSQNILFWSEVEKKYVLFYRKHVNGLRSIAKRTSLNLIDWTNEKVLDINEKGEHLYTSGLFPYYREKNIYIGFATRFFPDLGNSTDIVLLTSREGNGVQRKYKQAIIKPGFEKKDWENRNNYITLNGLVPFDSNHDVLLARGKHYIFRKDGFASLKSNFEEGYFVTRPVKFDKTRITLNFKTSAGGYIKILILDNEDNVLNSNTKDERIIGNKTEFQYDLDFELSHEPVRIKFVLKEAELYSFIFSL